MSTQPRAPYPFHPGDAETHPPAVGDKLSSRLFRTPDSQAFQDTGFCHGNLSTGSFSRQIPLQGTFEAHSRLCSAARTRGAEVVAWCGGRSRLAAAVAARKSCTQRLSLTRSSPGHLAPLTVVRPPPTSSQEQIETRHNQIPEMTRHPPPLNVLTSRAP